MRTSNAIAVLSAAALCGCGLESVFNNAGHDAYPRPASAMTGPVPWQDATASQFTVTDGAGNALTPFYSNVAGGSYELRLPSGKYQFVLVHARQGNLMLSALVPAIGEESSVGPIALDARSQTELLIVQANLTAKGKTFAQLTPEAYSGTRKLIYADFDTPGPTQDLLHMVERLIAKADPASGAADPAFFNPTVYQKGFVVKTSALDASYLKRTLPDYDGDGIGESTSTKFDTLLGQVAQAYKPEGCPDPNRVRVVFTVQLKNPAKNGVCNDVNAFDWAVDKPGKSMFFVGWIHKDSPQDLYDPAVNSELGASVPNQIPMHDDGTNGDEVAGDGIWTVYFDVPRGSAGHRLRLGYKYTWGFRGGVWTGSEEWPGNSRILEVQDDNGDDIVYRRDVFRDEATNKDNSNLNPASGGSISWTTDLHGCGTPESHENKWYAPVSCASPSDACLDVPTPKSIGPLTVLCSQ